MGSKSELLSKVNEYCRSQQGYDDVLSFCESYKPRVSRSDNITHAQSVEDFGFVYLIKSGKFYMLGRTNATGRRERELVLQLPERIVTIPVIRTDDPPGIEAYWHRRFATKRKNGEWFDLSAADVVAFKRRKFM